MQQGHDVPADEQVSEWIEHRLGDAKTLAEAAARLGLKQEAARAMMRRFGVPLRHEAVHIHACAEFAQSIRALVKSSGLPEELVREYARRSGISCGGKVNVGRPSGYTEDLVRQTVPACYTWAHAANLLRVSESTAKRWAQQAGVTLAKGGQV